MHPSSVPLLYKKNRRFKSTKTSVFRLIFVSFRLLFNHIAYFGQTGVNDPLNVLHRHILLLSKLLEGHAVKQLALEDRAVALTEDPFINERAPLRP